MFLDLVLVLDPVLVWDPVYVPVRVLVPVPVGDLAPVLVPAPVSVPVPDQSWYQYLVSVLKYFWSLSANMIQRKPIPSPFLNNM